ncbi:hypothetical protein [Pedobacter panaciterrae]
MPVLEKENTAKDFFDSLKRGNIQLTDYTKPDGTTEKMYFEANPKHDMINQYDKDLKPILLSLKTQQVSSENLSQQSELKEGQSLKKSKSNVNDDNAEVGEDDKSTKKKIANGFECEFGSQNDLD